MGFVQKRLSDISGRELADDEVVTVVDKTHGKVFDAAPDELKTLKAVNNVIELEVRYPSGQVATVLVQKADYHKLVPEDKLAGFDSNRGRRSGYSPTRGSSLIRSSTNGATV